MPTVFRGLILLCLLQATALAQEAIDRGTQRNGMHTCPAGQFMTGVHVGNNQFLCAPGKGDFAHEIVDANTVRNQMHACPVGYAMTGLHVDANLLSCVKLIDPPQPPVVDPGTARMGMHACPTGRFMSGIHVGNNQLLCGADLQPWMCTSTDTIIPRYVVLTVIYAPPGTSASGQKSTVEYGAGSTAGTTTSATSTFKRDWSVNASVCLGSCGGGGGGGGNNASFGVSAGNSEQTANTTSLDIKQSSSNAIKIQNDASVGDGVIDHSKDLIYVWPGPIVGVCINDKFKTAQWSLPAAGPPQRVLAFQAGWLVAWLAGTIPPESTGMRAAADAVGFTRDDWASILAQDPYGRQGTTPVDPKAIDAQRFGAAPRASIVYAPINQSDTVTLKNDATTTQASTSTSQYSVTASGGIKVSLGVASIGGGASTTWTWTNSATQANSTNATETATLVVASPSANYKGTPHLVAYWDAIYRTFLFAFLPIETPVLYQGTVQNAAGQPAANQEVIVTAQSGRRIRAYTNRRGEYRVVGLPPGPAQIQVGAQRQAVVLGPSAKGALRLK